MLNFAVAMLIAVVVPFIITWVVGKQRGLDKVGAVDSVQADGLQMPTPRG